MARIVPDNGKEKDSSGTNHTPGQKIGIAAKSSRRNRFLKRTTLPQQGANQVFPGR
jgi:hypothetical protein